MKIILALSTNVINNYNYWWTRRVCEERVLGYKRIDSVNGICANIKTTTRSKYDIKFRNTRAQEC